MRSPSLPSALSRRSFVVKAALAAVGGVGVLRAARAQAQDKPTASPALAENVSLRQLMTPEQFKAAGLNKLSPDELANLERFLKGYRDQTVEAVAKETEERAKPTRNRAPGGDAGKFIQAHVQGSFDGLKGRTLITLDNGSVWRQANDEKVSVHLDSPEVILVRSAFGYRMFVVGLTKPFYVRQILQN